MHQAQSSQSQKASQQETSLYEPSVKTRPCYTGRWITWIIFSLIFIIGIASGISSYRFWDLHQHTGNKIYRVKTEQMQLQDQLQQLSETLVQQRQQIKSNQKLIENLLLANGHDSVNWKLIEARHFIQLANINLQMERDIPTVIAILKHVNASLETFSVGKLLPIRKLLTQKITTLQAMPTLDRESIYLKLDALNTQIDDLPWHLSEDKTAIVQHNNESSGKQAAWRRTLDNTWRALTKVIIIRHHYQPIQPLLTAKQRELVNLNLRVWITETQWALLRHENIIYQNNLKKIQQAINHYFAKDSTTVKSIDRDLVALQKINISPLLPDLDDIAQAVDQMIDLQVVISKQSLSAVKKDAG